MLKTRLWMGSLLILFASFILWEPWPSFPFLFCTAILIDLFLLIELRSLLPPHLQAPKWLLCCSGLSCILLPWMVPLQGLPTAWLVWLLCNFVFINLYEMYHFDTPNHITARMSIYFYSCIYLGLLPSIWLSLRFLPGETANGMRLGTLAFGAAVLIPKLNDIGAYFTGKFLTGRVLGRTLMTPKLSPKKTWQGAIGGMISALIAGLVLQFVGPLFSGGWIAGLLHGFVVGIAGIFGDLAESLLKRDLATKDASQLVPGFGGGLDVADSILWAAPMIYLAIQLFPPNEVVRSIVCAP